MRVVARFQFAEARERERFFSAACVVSSALLFCERLNAKTYISHADNNRAVRGVLAPLCCSPTRCVLYT